MNRMAANTENEELQVVGLTNNPMLAQVWRLTQPLCLGEGVELVHVEYQRAHGGRTLRIYLDKTEGITLDDCANISRQLSDILDVGLETDAPYRLEVSSPGMPRPMGKIDDFDRFKGGRIKIRTSRPVGGQKNFTGILDGVRGPMVRLYVDNQSVDIAFGDIAKAHITHF
jgi:ribosome maturation factor RimP